MDEVIVSEFTAFYYAKIIGFGLIAGMYVAGFIYEALFFDPVNISNILYIAIICLALLFLYFYSLLRICKTVSITADEITINYLIFKRQLQINFADVVSANTYRRSIDNRYHNVYNMINYQSLVVEFKDCKSISLGAGDYSNYDELKAAIYKYRYGIGL